MIPTRQVRSRSMSSSNAASAGQPTGDASAHLLVVSDSTTLPRDVVELMSTHGYRTTRATSEGEALSTLSNDRPGVVLVADRDASGGGSARAATVRAAAAELGIPVLAVVADLDDPASLAARLADVDDWVSMAGAASELPVRVGRLLAHQARDAENASAGRTNPMLGPEFLSLAVHDLRTPLNVIGLTIRIFDASVPRNAPNFQEDLRCLEENFQVMVRMLQQINDFHRLYESAGEIAPIEFDPRRLVDDLVEEARSKSGANPPAVTLVVDESCPAEVTLDPIRAKQALQYALANAASAARERVPVRVIVRGGADRWITELAVDQPPPPTVQPLTLRPDLFERLCGTDAERRGVDLAIAAKISALFGGTARLEVYEGRGTSVVLDWPTRLSPTA
jgi:signal transduction histidine kinase